MVGAPHLALLSLLIQESIAAEVGLTQRQISNVLEEKPEISEKTSNDTQAELRRNCDTQLLDLACEYQESRVDKKSTSVYFDFTEGWFRNSGIYDLNPANQTLPCLY